MWWKSRKWLHIYRFLIKSSDAFKLSLSVKHAAINAKKSKAFSSAVRLTRAERETFPRRLFRICFCSIILHCWIWMKMCNGIVTLNDSTASNHDLRERVNNATGTDCVMRGNFTFPYGISRKSLRELNIRPNQVLTTWNYANFVFRKSCKSAFRLYILLYAIIDLILLNHLLNHLRRVFEHYSPKNHLQIKFVDFLMSESIIALRSEAIISLHKSLLFSSHKCVYFLDRLIADRQVVDEVLLAESTSFHIFSRRHCHTNPIICGLLPIGRWCDLKI